MVEAQHPSASQRHKWLQFRLQSSPFEWKPKRSKAFQWSGERLPRPVPAAMKCLDERDATRSYNPYPQARGRNVCDASFIDMPQQHLAVASLTQNSLLRMPFPILAESSLSA
jgi:hypothetical protein